MIWISCGRNSSSSYVWSPGKTALWSGPSRPPRGRPAPQSWSYRLEKLKKCYNSTSSNGIFVFTQNRLNTTASSIQNDRSWSYHFFQFTENCIRTEKLQSGFEFIIDVKLIPVLVFLFIFISLLYKNQWRDFKYQKTGLKYLYYQEGTKGLLHLLPPSSTFSWYLIHLETSLHWSSTSTNLHDRFLPITGGQRRFGSYLAFIWTNIGKPGPSGSWGSWGSSIINNLKVSELNGQLVSTVIEFSRCLCLRLLSTEASSLLLPPQFSPL